MANPITKILHFAEEIQNVHSAGSPIEVTECDPTPTPTPEQATPTPEQATPTPIAQDQETPTPINDGGGVVDDNTSPSNCHQGGHPDIIAYSTLTGSVGQTEVHVWDQVQASWNKKGDTIDNLTNVVSSHDGNVLVGKIDGYSIQSFHWEDNTWKPKGNPISIGPFHLPASYPVNPSSGTPEKRAVSDVSISDDGNVIAYSTGNNQTQQNSDGEVYVFEWTGTEWTQKGSTMRRTGWTWPASGQSNDPHGFGASIKLSGDGNSIGVGIVVWGQFRLYTYTTDWVMVDSRGEGQITTGILPSYSGTSIDVSCSGRFMAATVPIKRAVADSDGNPRYTSAIYWASNDTTADNYFGQNMSADIFSEIGGIGTHYGHGLQQTWAYDARHTMAYSVTESKTGNISSATIAYVIPSDDPEYQYDYNNHDADLHGDTPHLLKVFERTWGTEWTQKGESIKLYGINMETNATLSIDMSDDGNTIVVVNSTGSIFNSGFDKNAIDVYDWSSCTWTKRASITPSEAVQTASISYIASTGIPSYHSSCQTPTPIPQLEPTPTPFDYGADLCPVSYGYYSSLHNFWVTPDKKLIAFSRKSGDIYPKYPSEFVTIDTDVVDMNASFDTCFYKKSDNKLYGIGSNTTNKINSDNTMYFVTPQLIASDVKNFGLGIKGVWYVSTVDVGYYKGEDRSGIIDGSNQYDANRVLTSFVEVATNVDHMSIATNSSLLTLVVFNDKKLKYKGTIPALSADFKEEWTLISDNVLKALTNTVKACFYLKTDNTLHGIARVVDGVLGEPVTVPAGTNDPWNYTEHRQIAENVIDFHAKQTLQIHYIDKENNLYGRGLSVSGFLGNAITKTRNPAGNTATSSNAPVVATWQLIDENVSNLYFNGGGSYKKYDGSLYICGNPPSVNMVVYPYVGLLETSVLTDYPHKVCNAYLDQTPTPEQATPTPTPEQATPTPTNGNGGTGNNGGTGGGDGNLSSPPIVGVRGEYCTSDTTPTWTIDYDTNYPTPIEYEVKIGSSGNVVTITEQTYTSPEELPHGNHTFYVRGKSSQNLWSTWSDFTTEVRTHMPNVPVLYHTKSHARYGSTQAINSWPTWTVWGWHQVTDADGYGIKVNDEDEHLIGPGTTNMDGQMWYGRDKDSLGIGTHTVKVRARDCAGNWSDHSNEVTFTITEAEQNPVTETNCILPPDSSNWQLIGEIEGATENSQLGYYKPAINYDGSVIATALRNPTGFGSSEAFQVFHKQNDEWIQKGSNIFNPENPHIDEITDEWAKYDELSDDITQLSADGHTVAFGGEAVAVYRPDSQGVITSITRTGAVAIYKFDGSDWNQLGQTVVGTFVNERHVEEFHLSADGTRFCCRPRDLDGDRIDKILTYEYNESENLWQVINTLDVSTIVETEMGAVKILYSDDLKTISCPVRSSAGEYSQAVFEYNDEQSEWTQKGQLFPQLTIDYTLSADGNTLFGATSVVRENPTGTDWRDRNEITHKTYNYLDGTWVETEVSSFPYSQQNTGSSAIGSYGGDNNNYYDLGINDNVNRFIHFERNDYPETSADTDPDVRWPNGQGVDNKISVYDRVGVCWQKIGNTFGVPNPSGTIFHSKIHPTHFDNYLAGINNDKPIISKNGKVIVLTESTYQHQYISSSHIYYKRGRILIYSHPSESLPSEFPTLAEEPTPTPTEEPSLSGDDVNELEFRWADGIVADEKILQVKNLLKPTHSDNGVGNFDDRDMSAWSTLYTSNQNEDNHDLSSAFWPDAAVDENYTFAKTIDFENARIILDDTDLLPNNEVSNLNYYQLYIDFDNSNADLEPTTNTGNTIQPLYIYFGDTTDPEASASGKTQFNSVITKMATATSTSESASGTKVIEISNSDTTKFKAGMNVIISPDNDAIREENVIESLGSLNLQNNLQNTHPSGSSVVQKPSSASANGGGSTTPTPSSSPSPNECDGLSAKRCYSPYAGWNYVRSTPSANGNCYRGCTQCEDDTRQCGAETKEEFGPPQTRSYNLGCGFPECECNETVQNFWNGAQYDPSPQDKTYTRVNETECKVDKPTCSQVNKTNTKVAAEDACEDACNGRDVVWNDDICAWECAKADVCDVAKRNCLEQKAPDCDQTGETKTLKKTVNPNTCEYEGCECIDLDANNDDHKCFDKDGNSTGMKTLNDQCEFEDCCEETYIPSDCANNKVKKVNTDCTEGPCECVKDEVDDPGCGLAAVGHGPEHSVWNQALCKYTCECDWDFIEQQDHNKTMINDCNDTPNKKVFRNETNCTLECICDPEPCPEGKQGTLNNDTCEYENCECTEQPDNTTQMCADGTTQQTWDDTECKWTPDCPDVACGPDQHSEWKLPNGDSCNPSHATLKTFFGLSMNLNNVWENVFDGLSIKFGEQETANGVDYLPIYAKVDKDKMALSSGNNISEWNKLFIFVGDNKSPNNHANGEGIEFDTIISDDLMLLEQHTNSISAKIHFRFANINGIPTLQIKNILKPTNSAFENRDTENDWSSVYVGLGYNLNDDVWPTASVDVNYEIGPMTYSSTDCQEYCVDDPTPTPVDYIEGGGT